MANLQLVVTNVHVRYEDDVAWPGHTLSVGILLSRLAAHTVNEAGEPAWVAASLQQLLRKVRWCTYMHMSSHVCLHAPDVDDELNSGSDDVLLALLFLASWGLFLA